MANENEISKLQAVKELIFGQEIKDYDAEFQKIHNNLEAIEAKSEDDWNKQQKVLSDLEKNITNRIDRLENELMKRLANLEDKKTDRAKLGKLLIQIGEKLQNNN